MGLINMLNSFSFQVTPGLWSLITSLLAGPGLEKMWHVRPLSSYLIPGGHSLLRSAESLHSLVIDCCPFCFKVGTNIMFFYYFLRMWSQYKEQQLQIHKWMWKSCGKIEEPSQKTSSHHRLTHNHRVSKLPIVWCAIVYKNGKIFLTFYSVLITANCSLSP